MNILGFTIWWPFILRSTYVALWDQYIAAKQLWDLDRVELGRVTAAHAEVVRRLYKANARIDDLIG